MNVKRILVWGVVEGLAVLGLTQCLVACRERAEEPAPRIVNIINFVRQTEPRPVNISDEDLFLTTLRQVELLEKHRLRGTFLLQYDALLNPRYQELMRRALKEGSEVGGWWEITQPHVEAAGMTWRGAYPWDWHANVGFSTGYTPEEREKLVDVYMAEFKKIFGAYPTAVGSWFIDAHTLQYMADRYRIVASCNCRDQVGTDGYTLWGGYWNQAYYPSRKNAYMPAQTPQEQIGVPVFRMLGSDPINQYDSGLGLPAQGVETLEPAYTEGGGNPVWIDWFFDMLTDGPCLAFQSAQVGQENSFTWPRMRRGLEYQVAVADSLSRAGALTVQTLSESGRWFKERFAETPATCIVAMKDSKPAGRKTVWYDSRFYRANVVWEDSTLRFRDIHLFDERLPSAYLTQPGTSTQCLYTTLPLVDGFNWSSTTETAGLRLVEKMADGSWRPVPVGMPAAGETAPGELTVTTPILAGGSCRMVFDERAIRIRLTENAGKEYRFVLTTAPEKALPFTAIEPQCVRARIGDLDYRAQCTAGTVGEEEAADTFLLMPDADGSLTLDLSQR